LSVVGGSPDLFDDIACAAVYFFTFGVPRLINLLCDQAMMYAFAEDEYYVTFHTVNEVVADRNSSGLSSFRPIEEDMTEEMLLWELRGILDEIRLVRGAQPHSEAQKDPQLPNNNDEDPDMEERRNA
jgi:hypothetical protein